MIKLRAGSVDEVSKRFGSKGTPRTVEYEIACDNEKESVKVFADIDHCPFLPQSDEHLLHDFFLFIRVLDVQSRERKHFTPIPLVKRLKGHSIPISETGYLVLLHISHCLLS